MNAIAAAQSLSIPTGVTIYGDIETGVTTNTDWFFGWWETMNTSIYTNAGGFYCNAFWKRLITANLTAEPAIFSTSE